MAVVRPETATKDANSPPARTHRNAANRAPISAARNLTLVFGTNMYRNVKTPVTIRYGASRPAPSSMLPNGSICDIRCTNSWLVTEAIRPIATTIITGPSTITLRYSLMRLPKLRGCSTRQTKLKLSSIFWTIEMTVYSRIARPIEPSTPPWMLSTNSMMRVVISGARSPSGARNS